MSALGEVMLRLDPGNGRIRTARSFDVWEGGGEYNVARALRRCFGLRTAVVTALVDNDVGRLVESLMEAGGVDTSHVCWRPFDGVGAATRIGLNFTERGFGLRPARTVYDRGNSAAASHGSRRCRLGAPARRRRRALAAQRGHLRRPVPDRAGRAARGVPRGQGQRHGRLLRPQLPRQPVGGAGRARPGGGRQPGPRAVRRRDARQRGGLHGGPRLRRSPASTTTSPISTRRTSRR